MNLERFVPVGGSFLRLASISFFGRVFGRIIKYALIVVLGSSLGAGFLGKFTLGFVVVQICANFSNLGIEATMRKFVPVYRNDDRYRSLSGLVIFGTVVSLVGGSILSGVTLFLAREYNLFLSIQTTGVVEVLIVTIPALSLIKTFDAVALGFDRTEYSVYIRDIGQEGLAFVCVGLAVLFSRSDVFVAKAYAFSMLPTVLIGVWAVHRVGGFDEFTRPSFEIGRWTSYSVVTSLSSLTQLLVGWTDVLVIAAFLTSAPLGRYQAAYQTAALLTFSLVSANSIFPSVASRLYDRGDMEQLRKLYRSVLKWIISLTLAALAYVLVLPGAVISLFGESFQNASGILTLLAVAQTGVAMVGPAGYLLLMTGHERLELGNKVVLSVLNTGGNLLLVPRYGITGAAVATGLSLFILNICRAAEVQYLYGIYPDTRFLIKAVIPSTLIVLILIAVNVVLSGDLIKLAVTIPLGAAVFFASSCLFVSDDSDRLLLESI